MLRGWSSQVESGRIPHFAALFALITLAPGCNKGGSVTGAEGALKECKAGAAECQGQVARTCIQPDATDANYTYWSAVDCLEGQACKTVDGAEPGQKLAVCARGPAESNRPECAENRTHAYCRDKTVVRCGFGFELDAITCEADEFCVDPVSVGFPADDVEPFCALTQEPDKRCGLERSKEGKATEGSGQKAYCDGARIVACDYGFPNRYFSDTVDCKKAELCKQLAGTPLCVLGDKPDAKCKKDDGAAGDADPEESSYCDGEVAVDCFEGYATARTTCEMGCSVDAEYAYCDDISTE